jgi:thiol-disulfide isomerase/thioredoxin
MIGRSTYSRVVVWLVMLLAIAACVPDNAASTPAVSPPEGEPNSEPSGPSATRSDPSPSEVAGGPLTSDPLHAVELVDVNTGAAFNLGELAADGPVLLEMMAIWCTNCRAQQHEVIAAHELATFDSVSLDIDPNERPDDLADYSAAMGFNWRFALANQVLASGLRDRFGAAVLNPPSTPMVLLFPDGSVRALEFRGYSAAELAAEIAAG